LQDYVPSYPDYKVFLSIHYGSALPVTVPINKRWDNVYKILPSYKRVDIGVSKVIKSQDKISKYKALNLFKEVTVSLEVFNLIGISNTVSFMWIKTFSDEEGIPAYFAVPNYLTSRRINFKISANF